MHPRPGYFSTLPPGAWRWLPDDARVRAARCTGPTGSRGPTTPAPNHHDARARRQVHAAFRRRGRGPSSGAYARGGTPGCCRASPGTTPGTTDENIQWAACKWGLSDNLLRAIAVRGVELVPVRGLPGDGTCVVRSGCGDLVDEPTPRRARFCAALAGSGRATTRPTYGAGSLPEDVLASSA